MSIAHKYKHVFTSCLETATSGTEAPIFMTLCAKMSVNNLGSGLYFVQIQFKILIGHRFVCVCVGGSKITAERYFGLVSIQMYVPLLRYFCSSNSTILCQRPKYPNPQWHSQLSCATAQEWPLGSQKSKTTSSDGRVWAQSQHLREEWPQKSPLNSLNSIFLNHNKRKITHATISRRKITHATISRRCWKNSKAILKSA